jgi:translation initiation factor 3 subunit B
MELASPSDAALAARLMDGYAFDKRHRFAVNRFTDIEKLANLDDEYAEPEAAPYEDREHLRSWLLDPANRDQLVMCRGDDVQIAWHNRAGAPEVAHERQVSVVEAGGEWSGDGRRETMGAAASHACAVDEAHAGLTPLQRWTESYVQWSPLGTFLTTFHRQGIALWGGASWERFMRFAHPGARLVDFSPSEKYMVTWSHDAIVVPEGAPQGPQFFSADDEGNRVAVWEVRTGHLLRTFPVAQDGEAGAAGRGFSWPLLKWSGDDQYCARVVPGKQISVYELPSMGLLDKKSIAVEGVVDFEWCPLSDKDRDAIEAWGDGSNPPKGARKPRDNMISFWLPEVANQPARATVMAIPSREIIRSKNLFNVSDCKLHWHPQGDYLCVKVDRHTKTKKSTFCNFELFRMREKDYPVEVVEIKGE